jgi:Isochorismatase family
MNSCASVAQVVLAGISTSIGVESTARSAYDYGYNVALVIDAMTDRNADAHRHSVETIFPRLGETATTDAVLNLLRVACSRFVYFAEPAFMAASISSGVRSLMCVANDHLCPYGSVTWP